MNLFRQDSFTTRLSSGQSLLGTVKGRDRNTGHTVSSTTTCCSRAKWRVQTSGDILVKGEGSLRGGTLPKCQGHDRPLRMTLPTHVPRDQV